VSANRYNIRRPNQKPSSGAIAKLEPMPVPVYVVLIIACRGCGIDGCHCYFRHLWLGGMTREVSESTLNKML